jgi:quercetin dioxygenase-like cupin family protein
MKNFIRNPIIKDTATFIQTASGNKGKITEIDFTLMPGGGNPFHFHRSYLETFIVLQGELGLVCGKKNTLLKEGDSFTVPPMQVHRFYNPGDKETRFKVILTPGHEGMENALRILYGMAGDGLTNKKSIPKKIKHIALIAYTSDMNLPGLPNLFFPILKIIARKAIAKGEYEVLKNRYCN